MAKRPTILKPAAITLATIAGFGETGTRAPMSELTDFIEKGYVETDPAGVDEHGVIGVRITQAGINFLKSQPVHAPSAIPSHELSENEVVAETAKKVEISIDDAIPVPTGSTRGRKGTIYPFDKLEIGQSFFIANPTDPEAKSDAFKSLSSTAASATRRYTEGDTVHKRFIVRRVTENGIEGARCWRVQV